MPTVSFLGGSDEASGGWRPSELQHLLAMCSASVAIGAASGWALGETERADPQLYLLGPEPECDCILIRLRNGHLRLAQADEVLFRRHAARGREVCEP